MQYEEVTEYVQGLVGEGDDFLASVHKKSNEMRSHGVFSIDPSTGRFLELLIRARGAKRILEVGSGVGYSAMWFVRGMRGHGTMDAIEYNPETADQLRSVMTKAGFSKRVRIHRGEALQILRRLNGKFDVVFIDADKDEYPQYLDHALRLTRRGSIILAHNMFWGGGVLEADKRREGTEGIMSYTKRIFNDERLTSLILPLGDGLAFSYRLK